MDLGTVSLRDLLVHQVGMGDEPFGAAGCGHLLDRNFHGRRREQLKSLGAFWIAMGNRGAQQPVAAVIPAGLWALRMVSAMEIGKAIACRSCAGVGRYRRWKSGKQSLAGVVLASAIFLAVITPWLLRNYRVFHQPVFLRDNFGAELRMGNGPYADGTWQYYLHPSHDNAEFSKYRQMGELAYVQQRKQEAMQWIKANPLKFLVVSFRKFVYYWYGVPRDLNPPWLAPVKNSLFATSSLLMLFGLVLAFRQKRPHAWLFFWLLLLYPTIYYVVFPHARYRHPVDPEITVLAVFLISQAKTKRSPGTNSHHQKIVYPGAGLRTSGFDAISSNAPIRLKAFRSSSE